MQSGSRSRWTLAVIGGAALLLALAAAWRVVTNARAGSTSPPETALTVDIVAARVQPMPILLQSVGQVVPEHTVQIRPQIPGMLREVLFTEGQSVSAGQRLFRIEQAPYQAAFDAANAAWENAKGNADRLEALVQQRFVTPQDYRNARTLANQAEAARRQAQINLAYTDVRAPISGRTGSMAVKSGNIVSPSDATQIVTINQMRPIQVQFSLPQQFLPRLRQYQAQHSIRVRISSEDGSVMLDEGTLVFIDNTVNASSGTVTLKARLANEQEQLWPGQYVGVSVQLTLEPRAVVVPQTAVQTGQDRSYVYVVAGDTARAQDITVDRQVGDLAVISAGLAGDERVVRRSPRNLRSGMKVLPGGGEAVAR
jgi:multidrug efflux system membrane fusion protein